MTARRRLLIALLAAALLGASVWQVFKVRIISFEDGSGAVAWCVPGNWCQ